MSAARCWWPLLDLDVEHERAVMAAVLQLPQIAEENGWASWSQPRGWRYAETLCDGEPTLFLICEIDVIATPVEYLPQPPASSVGDPERAALWQSRRGDRLLEARRPA